MEELKNEVEKVKDGLSKVISDTSDIVIDRFKNPYIIAFSISWVAFNWKAIAFFIFSKGNVEYKILTIKQEYSDIWHYFYYPLASAIVFLFLVPYLNQLNEWFLMFSIKKRADYINTQIVDKIKRETTVAIEEDKKQQAITFAREGKMHNEYVDKLNETITGLNDQLADERSRSLNEVISLQNEKQILSAEISNMIKLHNNSVNDLQADIQAKIKGEEEQKRLNEILNKENKSLSITLEEKNMLLSNYEKALKDIVVSNSHIMRFNNVNTNVLEYQNIFGVVTYFDLIKNRIKPQYEMQLLLDSSPHRVIDDKLSVSSAIETMWKNLTDADRSEIENKKN
ncbi:hypothetical protein [Chryseobacterium arthrosphaerae]|uniref:hypothetical protein n=1 Tax=Chryseobacterium arthrosphaerae TaxID=651561 RepID=UPI00241BE7D9|nr:hypothetical protein [Chryseobacterium arthrosphaerae]